MAWPNWATGVIIPVTIILFFIASYFVKKKYGHRCGCFGKKCVKNNAGADAEQQAKGSAVTGNPNFNANNNKALNTDHDNEFDTNPYQPNLSKFAVPRAGRDLEDGAPSPVFVRDTIHNAVTDRARHVPPSYGGEVRLEMT